MFPVPMRRTAPRSRRDCSGAVGLVSEVDARATTEREGADAPSTTWSARLEGVAMVVGLLAAAILMVSVRASSEEWRHGVGEAVIAHRTSRLDGVAASGAAADTGVRRHRPGIDSVDSRSPGRRNTAEFPDFPLVREEQGRVYPQLHFSF